MMENEPIHIARLTVNFAPVPQPRPRAKVVWMGSIPRPQIYEDSDHPVGLWKIRVLDAWRLEMPYPGFRFEGPLLVNIEIISPRPKHKIWKKKPMPRTFDCRSSTGDVDNLAKSILDALNKKAWNDDRQVCQLHVEKYMAAGNEKPRAEIEIMQIEMPEESIIGAAENWLFD